MFEIFGGCIKKYFKQKLKHFKIPSKKTYFEEMSLNFTCIKSNN